MPARRLLWPVLLSLALGGCFLSPSPLTQEEKADHAMWRKVAVYRHGQMPPYYSKRLGVVKGQSCQNALFGPVASEDDALLNMLSQASAAHATAIIDANCAATSILYPQDCWPGYRCTGQMVQ